MQEVTKQNPFVDSEKLSELIGIPVYTVRKLTRLGIFPGYRIGERNYLYDPEEICKIIKNKACTLSKNHAGIETTSVSSRDCHGRS